MAGLNKAILIGNLGKDPEMRYTSSGLAIAKFSLATTERFKQEDRTEWHNIVAFDKLAEICGKYLNKGKQVYIEGRIQTNEWTDKDGNKRWTTEIIANTMQMLGTRDSAGAGGGYNRERQSRPQGPAPGPEPDQGPAPSPEPQNKPDDDIPF